MNELPVIESLYLRKDFWNRHGANIATRQKTVVSIIYMFTFSAGVPGIFLFSTRSSTEFVEKMAAQTPLNFSGKLSLGLGISFSIVYFILTKGNCSVKIIFISADDNFSPLKRHISDIAICLFNTLTSIKKGCIYKASCFRAIYG